jgi:aldehyde dehydrogenase (NAD+)
VTGNAVILRPSPLTPISALIFALAAEDAGLPPGVLNVLVEGGVEGAQILTTQPGVDMVAFTGSTNVGKQVMAQAAGTMKRVQLELGGKSAQIFLPDAASEAIVQTAGVCLSHAGQGCVLGTRVFVPEAAKSEVLAGMKAALENVPIGEVTDPGAMLGPVISAAQVERCEHFVRLAVENGATIVTGGKRPPNRPRGYFFQPTVIDAPDNQNPAAREEIFGPVVTVIGYRDVDQAGSRRRAAVEDWHSERQWRDAQHLDFQRRYQDEWHRARTRRRRRPPVPECHCPQYYRVTDLPMFDEAGLSNIG